MTVSDSLIRLFVFEAARDGSVGQCQSILTEVGLVGEF